MSENKASTTQILTRDSFILRIWREPDAPGWQGWVQHAGTGESVPVRRIDDLLAFIERRAGRLTDAGQMGLR